MVDRCLGVMVDPMTGEYNTAEQTPLAQGEYARFFERNKKGIQYVTVDPRTYYISRTWTVRGPIPKGVVIEMVGLANQKRASKTKRRRG